MGNRKRIEKKYEKVVPGEDKKKITTGIEKIDQFIKGGYKKGEIAVIAPPVNNRKSDFSHFMRMEMQKNRLNHGE